MNVLQIIAHPDLDGKSFTHQLANNFAGGAEAAGHTVFAFNPNHEMTPHPGAIQHLVLEADHICFAWPCWWEMPPAVLVELFQTVFVRGFAFDVVGDRMVPKLNIPVTCLISMGQQKSHNTDNLFEAMTYCGLHPRFALFTNVGPRLTADGAEAYLDLATRLGKQL